MELLADYVDSDDDATENEALKPDATDQRDPQHDQQKQSHHHESESESKTDPAGPVNVSDRHDSDSSRCACRTTCRTEDATLTMTESPPDPSTSNFFGLYHDDVDVDEPEEEEEEEEEKVVNEADANRTKPLNAQSPPRNVRADNHDSASSIIVSQSHISTNQKSGIIPSSPERPRGDFWAHSHDRDGQIDPFASGWINRHATLDTGQPLQINKHGNDQAMSRKHDAGITHQAYIPKKKRFDNHDRLGSGSNWQRTSSSLAKSFYYVHHKVAPFLHQGVTCKYPRRKQTELFGHGGSVNRIKWSKPQYSHLLLSASMDRSVKVWSALDSSSTDCVQTLANHTKAVKDATWSPCGRHIASCGYDYTARVSDVEKGTQLALCEHDSVVTCCCYHPVQPNILVSGATNCVLCWDTRDTSKPVRTYRYKDTFGQVQDIVFLPDGGQFFSCNDLVSRDSSDRNIMAWDYHKGVVLSNQIYQERYTCNRLKVQPRQPVFVAQTQANYIAEFSTCRPYKVNKCKRYEGHKVCGYNIGCDFSPDGQLLISGSSDGTAHVYSTGRAQCLHRLDVAPNSACVDVAWHPLLPSTVAMATWDGHISVWQ